MYARSPTVYCAGNDTIQFLQSPATEEGGSPAEGYNDVATNLVINKAAEAMSGDVFDGCPSCGLGHGPGSHCCKQTTKQSRDMVISSNPGVGVSPI